MVNRCFPCKMRDAFSGVPATKKFFMDWLHLLVFLEKGLCRFPVKNHTAPISRFYHVSITFVSRLSAKHDIFPHGGKGENAAAWKPCGGRNKGIGNRKGSRKFPGCPCTFLSLIRKGYHHQYAPLYPQRCNAECYIACLWCWSARSYSSAACQVGSGLHCGMCRGHIGSRLFSSWFPKDGHILSFFRLPFFRLVLV